MYRGICMKIDAVFSGGGVKAYAFIGALESIKENQLEITRVAGTSAGAIFAALLASGYKVNELKEIFRDINLLKFMDPSFLSKSIPFAKWVSFYFRMGLYKGDVFEKWLAKLLSVKGVRTFADLPRGHLKVVVSDISLGKLIILPDDLEGVYGVNPETFSVATAVRMSASFPFFFMPKRLMDKDKTNSYLVDGGLLSNFPLWIFKESNTDIRPVLGITLSDSLENNYQVKINNALDMLQALFSTMLRAHDARYISKSKQDNIIFLPVKDVKATNLKLTDKEKLALISLGREKSASFLHKWP